MTGGGGAGGGPPAAAETRMSGRRLAAGVVLAVFLAGLLAGGDHAAGAVQWRGPGLGPAVAWS